MPQFKRLAPAAIAAFLIVAVAGCSTSARRLDVAPVKQIVPGQTTVKQVEEIFGLPSAKLTGANGKTVARYFHHATFRSEDASRYEQHWRPGDLRIRTLTVLYDSNGVVERKLHDESISPVNRSRDWLEVGPMLRADEPSYIKKQLTTADDLIKRYGEPTSRTLGPDGSTWLMWLYMKDRADRLGVPVGRMLVVILDDRNLVADHALHEENPRVWLFGTGTPIRSEPRRFDTRLAGTK